MKPTRFFLTVILLLAIPCLPTACSPSSKSRERSRTEEHGEAEMGAKRVEDPKEVIVELSPEASARIRIRTASVEERALESELETTGYIDFDENRMAHVSPRVPGRVTSVFAELGAQVKTGQVLAQIDSIELGKARAEYLQARAQLDLARENFDREKGLFADRISSEQEMLSARAAYLAAEAALETAAATLHLYGLSKEQVNALQSDDPQASVYSIRAPFSGKVVERHATLGELVNPENNLFLIADLSRVWIWIDVYERDLPRVHIGDDVRGQADAYPHEEFRGKVSYLSDRVDPETRTVRARIDVPNPAGILRPGMFARIQLSDPHGTEGQGESKKTLVVPDVAIQRDGGEFISFVPVGENRFARREVRIGRKAGEFVEILDGLEAGERVVIEGGFLLKSEASKSEMGEGHTH